MSFRIRAWRAGHLLFAWCGYWLALALVAIGPALPTLWRVSRPGAHGNASVSLTDGALKLIINEANGATWIRVMGLGAIFISAAVGPLLLWLIWFRATEKHRATASAGRAH